MPQFVISDDTGKDCYTHYDPSLVITRYTQTNGYKPQPLDLSAIRLSSRLETLVDELAENTHNIWAKDRIHQGWTYGSTEVRFEHKFNFPIIAGARTPSQLQYVIGSP